MTFQPSAMTMPSTLTHLPSQQLSPSGIQLSTSCATAASNLEQYGLLRQYSLPATAATGASLWQPDVPTSTYTDLGTTMVTEPPPSSSAAATASSIAEEGMMAHSEGALVMAEEDDCPPWTQELGSEVFLLEFLIVMTSNTSLSGQWDHGAMQTRPI